MTKKEKPVKAYIDLIRTCESSEGMGLCPDMTEDECIEAIRKYFASFEDD